MRGAPPCPLGGKVCFSARAGVTPLVGSEPAAPFSWTAWISREANLALERRGLRLPWTTRAAWVNGRDACPPARRVYGTGGGSNVSRRSVRLPPVRRWVADGVPTSTGWRVRRPEGGSRPRVSRPVEFAGHRGHIGGVRNGGVGRTKTTRRFRHTHALSPQDPPHAGRMVTGHVTRPLHPKVLVLWPGSHPCHATATPPAPSCHRGLGPSSSQSEQTAPPPNFQGGSNYTPPPAPRPPATRNPQPLFLWRVLVGKWGNKRPPVVGPSSRQRRTGPRRTPTTPSSRCGLQ